MKGSLGPVLLAGVALIHLIFQSSCNSAAEVEVRKVRAADADQALQKVWGIIKPSRFSRGHPREWQMKQTPWLPSEWPPTRQTIWTRYAYGLDVTLDGSAGVSAPFARLECSAADQERYTLVPMELTRKSIAIHPVRPHGGWNYTLADESRVLARARALTSSPPQSAGETRELIAYYRSWRLGSAEIAAHVAPRHRSFFAWLDAQ